MASVSPARAPTGCSQRPPPPPPHTLPVPVHLDFILSLPTSLLSGGRCKQGWDYAIRTGLLQQHEVQRQMPTSSGAVVASARRWW